MAEPLHGYATEYARVAHIVAAPGSDRITLCGIPLTWIPARQFPPESIHAACRTALKNGAQAAYPDAWNDAPNPKDPN